MRLGRTSSSIPSSRICILSPARRKEYQQRGVLSLFSKSTLSFAASRVDETILSAGTAEAIIVFLQGKILVPLHRTPRSMASRRVGPPVLALTHGGKLGILVPEVASLRIAWNIVFRNIYRSKMILYLINSMIPLCYPLITGNGPCPQYAASRAT